MIQHYFKIALRNMRKYWSQTLISIVGLAVGFTCFALSALWIRYEMTFDTFHREVERIYVVNSNVEYSTDASGNTRDCPVDLAIYLPKELPEITEATAIGYLYQSEKERINGIDCAVHEITVDSSFFRLFDIKVIAGSLDFHLHKNRRLAISQKAAKKWFGNEDPLGKVLDEYGTTICAIVTDFPQRSIYNFDFLKLRPYSNEAAAASLYSGDGHIVVRIANNIDMKSLSEKIDTLIFTITKPYNGMNATHRRYEYLSLTPITKAHYTDPDKPLDVKFEHIQIFALAGLLVIFCTLFNYLTLFISRFRIRQKEFALRKVNGATERSLFALLSVEFSLSLLAALALGLLLIQLVHRSFMQLSDIQLNLSAIYGESMLYFTAVTVISLIIFAVALAFFRRRTLNAAIRRTSNKVSRKVSVIAQLLISIGFAFCTIVIVKQMHYLHYSDALGFDFRNKASIYTDGSKLDIDVLKSKIAQIPEVTNTLQAPEILIPQQGASYATTLNEKKERTIYQRRKVNEAFCKHYRFELLQGELLADSDSPDEAIINEEAVRLFNLHDTVIGARIGGPFADMRVKGVIRNVHNIGPTIPPRAYVYSNRGAEEDYLGNGCILFAYSEGSWDSCRVHIGKMLARDFPNDFRYLQIYNDEEEFEKFIVSERALLKLLTFVSIVCLLICIFGFVSLITLNCEERRKEIALRKINGATARDILRLFFRENFILLLIGAAIAFPVSYVIMRRWLEQYVKQTAISAWIYLAILAALAAVIVLCVGWRVWRASVENPAEVIKSE